MRKGGCVVLWRAEHIHFGCRSVAVARYCWSKQVGKCIVYACWREKHGIACRFAGIRRVFAPPPSRVRVGVSPSVAM